MLIHDRVCCDVCYQLIGQLFGVVVMPRALPDKSTAPHFAVCPDCRSVIDRSASSPFAQVCGK